MFCSRSTGAYRSFQVSVLNKDWEKRVLVQHHYQTVCSRSLDYGLFIRFLKYVNCSLRGMENTAASHRVAGGYAFERGTRHFLLRHSTDGQLFSCKFKDVFPLMRAFDLAVCITSDWIFALCAPPPRQNASRVKREDVENEPPANENRSEAA
jgi:hypothetical protein